LSRTIGFSAVGWHSRNTFQKTVSGLNGDQGLVRTNHRAEWNGSHPTEKKERRGKGT